MIAVVVAWGLAAFVFGILLGRVSERNRQRWTEELDRDEREWKRVGWQKRLERRRQLRQRFERTNGGAA